MPILQGVLSSQRRVNKRRGARWRPQIGAAGTSFCLRVAVAVEEMIPLEELGELALKGLTQPVVAFNVPASVVGAAAAS